ncbi:MAG: alpha-amylase family glycosyl hydrolase [Rhodothermales bacterium]
MEMLVAPGNFAPSIHPGMGAILFDGGCAFRVWAPFADAVAVIGTFNDWNDELHLLTSEGNGYWSADVADAKAGDEYRFVIHSLGHRYDRIDPYARQVTNSVGNAVIYEDTFDWAGDQATGVQPNEAIVYEMHVGTFNPSAKDAVGTLAEAADRLPYLRDLGITAIELMPLAEFAGDRSWGYNPAHPFAVEEAYGGPDALKAFVKAAHQLGLQVILDVVYNHFGPSDLDLWQFDGWSKNDKGGIYFYNDHRSTTPWGDTRPDYGREAVRDYIRDNARMWLDEFHLDGLRFDMTPYIFTVDGHKDSERIEEGWAFVQELNTMLLRDFPGRILIAEDLQTDPMITLPPEHDGAGFIAQWDAAFVHPVRDVLQVVNDADRDMHKVAGALIHTYNDEPFARVVYTESHDEVANGKARVPEEIWSGNADSRPARQRTLLGLALTLTAPGIPMLFQGQELLADRYFRDTVPLDWNRLDRYAGFHWAVRDLIALRRNAMGDTLGLQGAHIHIQHLDTEQKIIAYHRWHEGGRADSVFVVMHFADAVHEAYMLPFPIDGVWTLRFNSNAAPYGDDLTDPGAFDLDLGDETKASLALGPYHVLIYTKS